jgi:molybdopterin-guanine dinucleotide biosynthesis protein A
MQLSSPSKENTQAHILAGGQATRMQGEDKGMLTLNGKPLLEHVLERLRSQVDTIYISVNRQPQHYQTYGWPVISDKLEGFLGPLAGIHAAMLVCQCEWLLTVPVDSPFIPKDLLQRLSQAVISNNRPLAVVHDGKGLQPTFCLLHQSLAENLQHYLQQGGRKTGEWLRQQEPALADYADNPDAFINVNTPEDLAQAEQRLQHVN